MRSFAGSARSRRDAGMPGGQELAELLHPAELLAVPVLDASDAAQVEAMCAGSVDMGFFAPLQMTLLLSKGCGTPVLGAPRQGDAVSLRHI